MQAPCGKILRLDKKRAANKKTLNLRTDNIYDIVRFLVFGELFLIATKQFGHRKENYILFHIINSMDVPTYLIMLLVIFGMDVYGLIKYRKEKAPWKVIAYLLPVLLIIIAVNRVIKEYAPDTHLYNVSADVTLTIGGIYFVIVFIVGYINKKKQ